MELVPSQKDVVDLLRSTGALRSGHFQCPSGLHTNQYLETALVMRHYRHAKTLSVGLSRLLRANAELRAITPELSMVAATPAGLPVAYGLCEALHARQVYWAEKAGANRPMRFRQYLQPEAGETVVLVDDILRSGVLLDEARRLLESHGATVVALAVLIHQTTRAPARLRKPAALRAGTAGRHPLCGAVRLRFMPAANSAGTSDDGAGGTSSGGEGLGPASEGGSMSTAVMLKENLNPFEISQAQFETAADLLGLDEGMRAILKTPKRQLIVSIPVRMDDGQIQVFEGYRVQYNLTRGPGERAASATIRM